MSSQARSPTGLRVQGDATVSASQVAPTEGAPPAPLQAPVEGSHYDTVARYVADRGGQCVIQRILIATGGNAAVKAIRSLRQWSLETFGADRALEFVVMATPDDIESNAEYITEGDFLVEVPEGPSVNNYSNLSLVVQIAEEYDCDAVWPGWGHASEDYRFPEALGASPRRPIWIGPPASAMKTLGDKIWSTILAQSVGVPCLPWSGGKVTCNPQTLIYDNPQALRAGMTSELAERCCVRSPEEVLAFCMEHGFPAVLKASAGGGGKGIRKVYKPEDVEPAFHQVHQEVRGSQVFVMRLLTQCRHLEVQVLGDMYGNVQALGTRDCTVQRRCQKLIEEGPIVSAPSESVAQMEAAAIRLCEAVGYVNAGTCEFLYDLKTGNLYFLEVNARLQVEHVVTEVVGNLNLPAAQLQVAMKIPLSQIFDTHRSNTSQTGKMEIGRYSAARNLHCMAARVTAEHAEDSFRPTCGQVFELQLRSSMHAWGYFSIGATGRVHPYADSQIGHIFASGSDREEARKHLVIALTRLIIRGEIRTNVEALLKLLNSSDFIANTIHTTWVETCVNFEDRSRLRTPHALISPLSQGIEAAAGHPPARVDSATLLAVLFAAAYESYGNFKDSEAEFIEKISQGQVPSTLKVSHSSELVIKNYRFHFEAFHTGPLTVLVRINGSSAEVSLRPISTSAPAAPSAPAAQPRRSNTRPANGGVIAACFLISGGPDGRSRRVFYRSDVNEICLTFDGATFTFVRETDPTQVRAPVGGKLSRWLVPSGGVVQKGQSYAEIEIMKMYMQLQVTDTGTLSHALTEGAVFQPGDLLATLELTDATVREKPHPFVAPFPFAAMETFRTQRRKRGSYKEGSPQVAEIVGEDPLTLPFLRNNPLRRARQAYDCLLRALNGYYCEENGITTALREYIAALSDPSLPLFEIREALSVIEPQLPPSLVTRLQCVLRGEAGGSLLAHENKEFDTTSDELPYCGGLSRSFPASLTTTEPRAEPPKLPIEAKRSVDTATSGSYHEPWVVGQVTTVLEAFFSFQCNAETSEEPFTTQKQLEPLMEVLQKYAGGQEAATAESLGRLLTHYLDVEEVFHQCEREGASKVLLLKRTEMDPQRLAVLARSHQALSQRNCLLNGLLNAIRHSSLLMNTLGQYTETLRRLSELTKPEYASVSLRARQLLLTKRQQPFVDRTLSLIDNLADYLERRQPVGRAGSGTTHTGGAGNASSLVATSTNFWRRSYSPGASRGPASKPFSATYAPAGANGSSTKEVTTGVGVVSQPPTSMSGGGGSVTIGSCCGAPSSVLQTFSRDLENPADDSLLALLAHPRGELCKLAFEIYVRRHFERCGLHDLRICCAGDTWESAAYGLGFGSCAETSSIVGPLPCSALGPTTLMGLESYVRTETFGSKKAALLRPASADMTKHHTNNRSTAQTWFSHVTDMDSNGTTHAAAGTFDTENLVEELQLKNKQSVLKLLAVWTTSALLSYDFLHQTCDVLARDRDPSTLGTPQAQSREKISRTSFSGEALRGAAHSKKFQENHKQASSEEDAVTGLRETASYQAHDQQEPPEKEQPSSLLLSLAHFGNSGISDAMVPCSPPIFSRWGELGTTGGSDRDSRLHHMLNAFANPSNGDLLELLPAGRSQMFVAMAFETFDRFQQAFQASLKEYAVLRQFMPAAPPVPDGKVLLVFLADFAETEKLARDSSGFLGDRDTAKHSPSNCITLLENECNKNATLLARLGFNLVGFVFLHGAHLQALSLGQQHQISAVDICNKSKNLRTIPLDTEDTVRSCMNAGGTGASEVRNVLASSSGGAEKAIDVERSVASPYIRKPLVRETQKSIARCYPTTTSSAPQASEFFPNPFPSFDLVCASIPRYVYFRNVAHLPLADSSCSYARCDHQHTKPADGSKTLAVSSPQSLSNSCFSVFSCDRTIPMRVPKAEEDWGENGNGFPLAPPSQNTFSTKEMHSSSFVESHFVEEALLRNVVCSQFGQLELKRLSNFYVKLEPTSIPHIHLFEATPKCSLHWDAATGHSAPPHVSVVPRTSFSSGRTGGPSCHRSNSYSQSAAPPRFFVRILLHYQLNNDDDDDWAELERHFVAALNALDICCRSKNSRGKKPSPNHHILMSVLLQTVPPTVMLHGLSGCSGRHRQPGGRRVPPATVEAAVRALARRYQQRLIESMVGMVEVRFLQRSTQVTNPTRQALQIQKFVEITDPTTGELVYSALDASDSLAISVRSAASSSRAGGFAALQQPFEPLCESLRHGGNDIVGQPLKELSYDGLSVNTPHGLSSPLEEKRALAASVSTIYIYDFLELFEEAIRKQWRSCPKYFVPVYPEQQMPGAESSGTGAAFEGSTGAAFHATAFLPDKVLESVELTLNEKAELVETQRGPGQNDCGMVAWRILMRTPEFPRGRRVILVGNDVTFQMGTFGVQEDLLFQRVSERARREGIPRIYIAANSGARMGLATEVQKVLRVEWVNPQNPAKGFKYLYVTEEDYQRLRAKEAIVAEPVLRPCGTRVLRLTSVLGTEIGLGVENLCGSGAIAGETSRAYRSTFTITFVTGRTVGIGAYITRLGQRVIQKASGAPILLTGFQAINRLIGRDVYRSNDEIGGVDVMARNGVTHLVVADDVKGCEEIIRWLSYVPEHVEGALPIMVDPTDPIGRPVLYRASSRTEDPRLMLTGCTDAKGRWLGGIFDRGSFKEVLADWAKSVIVGRARLGGIPVGVIAVETKVTETLLPADPALSESTETKLLRAGQVWFPDSAYKTAQAIADFNREEIPLIIFANWRGFSGGQRDMFYEVLKFGSFIVDALVEYKHPCFVYIPPKAELRGGAWVVVDPRINSTHMDMFADPDSRGGVLEPTGAVEIKFRTAALSELADRLDEVLKSLADNDNQLAAEGVALDDPRRAAIKETRDKRLQELLPIYKQVAVQFADLHDTATRMKRRAAVSELVPWERSRDFFYWRLRRQLILFNLRAEIVKANPSLSLSAAEQLIYQWEEESGHGFQTVRRPGLTAASAVDAGFVNWACHALADINRRLGVLQREYHRDQILNFCRQTPNLIAEVLAELTSHPQQASTVDLFKSP